MATINTFGVTPSDIAAQVHNLTISPSSSPTTSQVEDYITYAAATVASEAAAAGIGVDGLEATSSEYILLKKAVISKATADIMVARNRGDIAAGAYYYENYKQVVQTLRDIPQRVAVDSSAGPDLASFVEQSADDLRDIPWYSTISGKIFTGGM
jgi:hypothetical protein